MTKSFEERECEGEEGGEQRGMGGVVVGRRVGGGCGSESPTPLCYEGKQVVSIIATDAGQCSWEQSNTVDSLF